MAKTIFDEKYKTPSEFKKAEQFLMYQLRHFYWRVQDIIKDRKKSPPLTIEAENIDTLKKSWEEDGIVLLKSERPSKSIDLINEEISRIRKNLESKGQGTRDEYGRTNRIVNIHSFSRVVFRFLCNQRIKKFLRFALNGEPVLVGSNTFDLGSEQDMHVDPQYVYTEPTGSFAGLWTALEDVHKDSGPVFYYEKSHLNPLKIDDVLDKHPNLKQKVLGVRRGKTKTSRSRDNWDLAAEIDKAYKKELVNYWENSGRKKIPILVEKGDTLIWNQWLAHGGLSRKNKELTRKSIAYHYCSKDCNHWPMSDFYLNSDRLSDIRPRKLPIKKCRDGLYLRQYLAPQILDY